MKQPKNKNRKKILLIILILLVVGGGFLAYTVADNKETPQIAEESTVNLSPPTEDEQTSGDKQKQEIVESENNSQPGDESNALKSTSVVITDAGQYDDIIEVRAFMPNHYQDGTCTITFTRGDDSVTRNTPAYRDATTTICTNPLIERNEFPSSGDWQLIVSYKSTDAQGTSPKQMVTIN